MMALEGLRVLDLSESVAGQYCSRLMAGYGAEVTLIEPIGGSWLRKATPISVEQGDSLLFYNLNLDKTYLQIDWRLKDGMRELRSRAAKADVVLVPQDFDSEGLRTALPHLVICEIGDFNQSGPYANWRGGEIVHQALAGTMYRNGRPGSEPLFGCGHRSYGMAGIAAYISVLSALRRKRGDIARIDVHATAASASYQLANQYLQNGTVDLRGGQQNTAEMVVPCREGWVVIFVYPYKWETFCNILGLDELFSNPDYAQHLDRLARWPEIVRTAGLATQTRDAHEVMATMQEAGVPTMMAFRPSDLHESEHLRQRNYWREVDVSDGRPRLALGDVYRMEKSAWRTATVCSPLQSSSEVSKPSTFQAQLPDDRNGAPLAGVRVLDLTTAWAGPLASRILAALGAEVVHVESVSRMDLARGSLKGDHPRRFVDLEPGLRPYDRAIFFNAQNLHKRSLCIDVKKQGGAEALRAVARQCDVILANFSPGTLSRLGLPYEELCKDNPGLVYVEMPACGTWGPMANYTGLGPNMEFASGMAAFVGYGDGEPFATGPAYLDPIGGYNGAAAIVTALYQRDRTGQGQYVEISQCETAMQLIGELILDCLERGADPQPQGNDRPDTLIHAAFPCIGHEEWIAISCSEHDWVRLSGTMADDGFVIDPGFEDAGYRARNSALLKERIANWTSGWPKQVLAERLQAAGIAAAPVNSGKDVAHDPQLNATGFFDDIWHPEVGVQRYQGLPFQFANAPLPRLRHAPALGQDTTEILESWGGLSRPEIEGLRAAGTIATQHDTPVVSDLKATG